MEPEFDALVARIDPDRIDRRLDDLAAIGRTRSGGVTRLAYTDEETAAIEYVIDELPAGYEVRTDPLGNVFAARTLDADRTFLTGSHLDTVFNGGRLDGSLGVVVAMEAIEAVHRSDADPNCEPTLVIFRAEESARFGRHTIGSRGALGMLRVEDLSATDQNDVPLWQAMREVGCQPGDLSEPTIDPERVAGMVEVHIEQGRVLDEADEGLGIVTSIRAPVRYRVTVEGRDDHSGATPMGLRRDAIAGAAELIGTVETIGRESAADGDLVATVGDVTPVDGAMNVVCGEVSFPLDVRSNDLAVRDRAEKRLLAAFDDVAERRGLSIDLEELDRSEPVELDDALGDRLAAAAASATSAHRRLPSGGGHDAMNVQLAGIPAGMVFVPSVDGVSHNPDEETDPEAVADAAAVIARTVIEAEPSDGDRA
ncbi:Zn-dependent hydrolase [Halovivax sp.]|uniref:Zn-dependent hydrolase n=1 Tax=Halovivax sp. TaxID=1935978 RepID=UPI0025B8DCE5|nr:Zn-dependent hydrolase [Halovivax sp.]